MKSVADVLRDATVRDVLRLAPGERLELAFRLGDEALATFTAAHGLDEAEALRRIRAQRRAGRRHSRCIEELDDVSPR